MARLVASWVVKELAAESRASWGFVLLLNWATGVLVQDLIGGQGRWVGGEVQGQVAGGGARQLHGGRTTHGDGGAVVREGYVVCQVRDLGAQLRQEGGRREASQEGDGSNVVGARESSTAPLGGKGQEGMGTDGMVRGD